MKAFWVKTAVGVVVTCGVAGCGTWTAMSDPEKGAAIGAGIGGMAGALVSGGILAPAGAAVGGALVGHEVGEREDGRPLTVGRAGGSGGASNAPAGP
jgi:osmotically inducible lipoprotein OsmB